MVWSKRRDKKSLFGRGGRECRRNHPERLNECVHRGYETKRVADCQWRCLSPCLGVWGMPQTPRQGLVLRSKSRLNADPSGRGALVVRARHDWIGVVVGGRIVEPGLGDTFAGQM